MRCTQVIGLNERTREFLRENTATTLKKCGCPTCTTLHWEVREEEVYASAAHTGMFDDGPELYKYRLKDGRWVFEYVQAVPWSSGPCIFLALQDEAKQPLPQSLWSEDEIANA